MKSSSFGISPLLCETRSLRVERIVGSAFNLFSVVFFPFVMTGFVWWLLITEVRWPCPAKLLRSVATDGAFPPGIYRSPSPSYLLFVSPSLPVAQVLKGKTLPNGKSCFEGRPGAEMPDYDFGKEVCIHFHRDMRALFC